MHQFPDVSGSSCSTAQDKAVPSRQRHRLSFFIIISTLAVSSLACGLFGSGSDQVAVQTRLPTLTRTPLPTLTPTSDATVLAQSQIDGAQAPIHSAAGENITNSQDSLAEPAADSGLPENQDSPTANQPADSSPVTTGPTETPASALESTQAGDSAAMSPQPDGAESQPPTATAVATPTPAIPPTATATEPPTPTATLTPTPSATPLPEGWVFNGVQPSAARNGGSPLLYGDVINNTGSPQELYLITANFYDQQGQLLPNVFTADYWPIETVPQGGRVPFELTVIGLDAVSDFDLSVDASPSEQSPHQNFEFSEVNQTVEEGRYCVSGRLKNLGGELKRYLSITAVLYDNQNTVISFNDEYIHAPGNLVGDQMQEFKVCADSFGQEIAGHELRAWGL